jgi:hypothetical protein
MDVRNDVMLLRTEIQARGRHCDNRCGHDAVRSIMRCDPASRRRGFA